MTAYTDVRRAVESVTLLFVAAGAGIVATMFLLEQSNDAGDTTFVLLASILPLGTALAASIVGGVLVGLRLDDPEGAALGTAIGCAIGFVALFVGTLVSHQLLENGTVDSTADLLREEWQLVSAYGTGVVVTGALSALAPSRLE